MDTLALCLSYGALVFKTCNELVVHNMRGDVAYRVVRKGGPLAGPSSALDSVARWLCPTEIHLHPTPQLRDRGSSVVVLQGSWAGAPFVLKIGGHRLREKWIALRDTLRADAERPPLPSYYGLFERDDGATILMMSDNVETSVARTLP